MKRKFSAALLALLLAVGFLPAAGAAGALEEVLLRAAQPVVAAYEAHYAVKNAAVSVGSEEVTQDGARQVQFFLSFDAALRYDNAMELPRVQGMANAVSLAQAADPGELYYGLCGRHAAQILQENALGQMETMALDPALQECFGGTGAQAQEALAQKTAAYVSRQLAGYAGEIQAESIGVWTPFHFDLRATLDRRGQVVQLEYGLADGYSREMDAVTPASRTTMLREGAAMANQLIFTALEDLARNGTDSLLMDPAQHPVFPHSQPRCTQEGAAKTYTRYLCFGNAKVTYVVYAQPEEGGQDD